MLLDICGTFSCEFSFFKQTKTNVFWKCEKHFQVENNGGIYD